MGPENKTTRVFNLLHNLLRLGPSPPTLGANNMMVVPWVINLTFPPTNIQSGHAGNNPTSPVTNELWMKIYYYDTYPRGSKRLHVPPIKI